MPPRYMKDSALPAKRSWSLLRRRCRPIHENVRSTTGAARQDMEPRCVAQIRQEVRGIALELPPVRVDDVKREAMAQRRPALQRASVGLVCPDLLQAGKGLADCVEDQSPTRAIREIGRMDHLEPGRDLRRNEATARASDRRRRRRSAGRPAPLAAARNCGRGGGGACRSAVLALSPGTV